jgi:hypothetical protein
MNFCNYLRDLALRYITTIIISKKSNSEVPFVIYFYLDRLRIVHVHFFEMCLRNW